MTDHALFSRYVRTCLQAEAFLPSSGIDDQALFAASLSSIRQHTAAVSTLVNADGQPFAVLPGFVDRMIPNAVADRFEGRHVIGFYQTLLVTIVEFALFAFTQRSVFPEIGDAGGEVSPSPRGGGVPGLLLLEKTLNGEEVEPEADRARVPKDATRHLAALWLALLMARFVWLHELAHCTQGHVGFVQAKGLALRLYELPERREVVGFPDRPDAQRSRADLLHRLELEADEAAFLGCCRIQLGGMENIEGIKALDLQTRLELTIFGAYAMTWLFEVYQDFMNVRHGLTHPAPRARLANLFRAASTQIGPEIEGFEPFHLRIVEQFNGLCRALPVSFGGFSDNRAQASLDGIDAERAALRLSLAPFRFDDPNR